MSSKLVFLNCNNPSELKEKGSQRIINAHIGKYHRNRSKPAQKAEGRLERDALLSPRGTVGHFQQLEVELINPTSNQHGKTASSRLQSTRKSASHPSIRGRRPKWKTRSPDASTDESVQDLTPSSNDENISHASQVLFEDFTTISPQSSRDEEEDDEDDQILDVSLQICLSDRVGQGRTDPFAVYPVKSNNTQVHALVDFAVQHYWSVLCPAEQLGVLNPVNNLYLQDMKSSPLAFYGYCLTIATAYDYLHVGQSQTQIFRPFRTRNIHALTRIVRETLSKMPENPGSDYITDHLVAAVMSLALNSYMKLGPLKDEPVSRFRSPMAEAQCINHFGKVPIVETHWHAVAQMVGIRGGITAVNPYCSHLCQSLDLLHSSFTSSKPTFPYHSFMLPLPPASWPFQLSQDLTHATGLASAFTRLPSTLLNDDNLKIALSTIAQTTSHLENYYLEGQPKSSWVLLVELRARAQHAALNLAFSTCTAIEVSDPTTLHPNTNTMTTTTTANHLSNILNHALLIYTNLVLYPMPPHCSIDTRLAVSLQRHLAYFLETSRDSSWTEWSDLLLWALILGGISDHKDTHREWYISQCSRVLIARPQRRKWLHLEQMLTEFLWLDFVLNEEAIRFWAQCESSLLASAQRATAVDDTIRKSVGGASRSSSNDNNTSGARSDSTRGLATST